MQEVQGHFAGFFRIPVAFSSGLWYNSDKMESGKGVRLVPEMEKAFAWQGRQIPYALAVRPVKHLNARVRPDGSLHVSAPPGVPEERIVAFLRQHAAALCRAMDENAARAALPPPPCQVREGAPLPLWGVPHALHLAPGERPAVSVQGGTVQMVLPPACGDRQRKRVLATWLQETLRTQIDIYLSHYQPLYAAQGALTQVTLRAMRSRWGSCCQANGHISYNTALVFAPLPAVEYVVVHELAHLRHPDHSPAFWGAVARALPDHRARRALLRDVDLVPLLGWLRG